MSLTMSPSFILLFSLFFSAVICLRYQSDQSAWNLNQNKSATRPVEYAGKWENHTFHPSPGSWRFPFYTISLDRYVDGDPTNNDANQTVFEHFWMSNQFRAGGDTRGLMNDLDYIQGMGIKALYLVGSPFINMPWSGDGYGPLDFTLLDHHHGVIEDWRALVTEIHRRDMYVILDNTLATMGDLIGFQKFMNESAPFTWGEYEYAWKSSRKYHDFQPGNEINSSCEYPRFWGEDGYLVGNNILDNEHGCRDSEFDQYGDMKGVGAYPSWQSQLSKFASVQDRLRIWRQDVLDKLNVMSCLQISMLDIDGFRMDKGLQTPVDAQASFATYQRECAIALGKKNFFISGEVVGELALASVYIGRGKQPDMRTENITEAQMASSFSSKVNASAYIREFGHSALDAAAFHYPTYGAMTRFLGLSGPIGFEGVDWVQHWTDLLTRDDMVNANTGEFDPRHMFGMTNQDVFRWPSLANGIQKQLLGFMVTTLVMPGIPTVLWGEEQEFYVLENLASDYVFGRTPMVSQRAWQIHGCYNLSEEVYVDMPFNSSAYGCYDDSVSLDHRDPSHPVRNFLKRMFQLRQEYWALNDGYSLQTMGTETRNVYLKGSGEIPTPIGIWSIYRGRTVGVQDFSMSGGHGNQGVWIVYTNENRTVNFTNNCQSDSAFLISAFPSGTTVKNLFYPYDEYILQESTFSYGIEDSIEPNGCLQSLQMNPWDYKAFVPFEHWRYPLPTITRVIPSHDSRIKSLEPFGELQSVPIEVRFSQNMSCESVTGSFLIQSRTHHNINAQLDPSSISCHSEFDDIPAHIGEVPTAWIWRGMLLNVTDGVHRYTIDNASAEGGGQTNAVDHFMFRIGQADNPMVFPLSSNYTAGLLHKDSRSGDLYISPQAAGADMLRYSTDWGSSYSDWIEYNSENITLKAQEWSGTRAQSWEGQHVIVNYWSKFTGSSDHIQHADLEHQLPRRWPHAFVEGSWNQFGYDGGLNSAMKQETTLDGLWTFVLTADWPSKATINVWGMNPDGSPDKSAAYGDVDGDGVLDWLPPDSLASNMINFTAPPKRPYTSFKILVNDGNFSYHLIPTGSQWIQLIVGLLIGLLPIITGILAILGFQASFYKVKFNETGISDKIPWAKILSQSSLRKWCAKIEKPETTVLEKSSLKASISSDSTAVAPLPHRQLSSRRTVLIATMEYEIEDWNIKVKIGGLGVMASLMGKSLGHQDLIWVIPCVGGIDYPTDQPAEAMEIEILDNSYCVEVQYHKLKNITFVLLDAPVFRRQTKSDPYPARMDDLDSAIFYAAWNACIAETMGRFPIDIYHINDYHGAAAPLYILPKTIPVCLSLHNAEFQGLWPLRTAEEKDEMCRTFNLPKEVVRKYVQYGEVFNLLHAGASYLRIHQNGFGAVGVSKKYGKRSYARYPIFWGLSSIGALPNPDPSDVAEWHPESLQIHDVQVDEVSEAGRGKLRVQAQEWASLDIDPEAELFVFVGRWSMQKGIDLIADVFFSVLEEHPNTQLICIGPIVDLYGKFAALKLQKMMEKYPGRVCSKPEFTMLPPYIFSGAEFALIPSRDEPFGLVAVEFGRKGALGVGARVGGLGQMPGWWYTIESTSTEHVLHQFKVAIREALSSKKKLRALMRARSALQRFPVAQWVADLETLQSTAISIHEKESKKHHGLQNGLLGRDRSNTTKLASDSRDVFHSLTRKIGSIKSNHTRSTSSSTLVASEHDLSLSMAVCEHPSLPNLANRSRKSSIRALEPKNSAPTLRPKPSNNSIRWADDELVSRQEWEHQINQRISAVIEHNESNEIAQGGLHDQIRQATLANQSMINMSVRKARSLPSIRHFSRRNAVIPRSKSQLRLSTVRGKDNEDTQFNLQKVDPFFTDSKSLYHDEFEEMLGDVNSKNSEVALSIEHYLVQSEKDWFARYARAKLGRPANRSRSATPTRRSHRSRCKKPLRDNHRSQSKTSTRDSSRSRSKTPPVPPLPPPNIVFRRDMAYSSSTMDIGSSTEGTAYEKPRGLSTVGSIDEFLLGKNYISPTGLRNLLSRKIGDWPVYAFLLALGQVISVSSYQITLLSGANGQAATKLYATASIYLAASVGWWVVFRHLKAIYVLSVPFFFYGLAFFLMGFGPFFDNANTRQWLYIVATEAYAIGAASGSAFFALNFGSEGGSPVSSWLFRACTIQGTQQIYIALLWSWSESLLRLSDKGILWASYFSSTKTVAAITFPVAVLFWILGGVLFVGLPDFFRQRPGKIPVFYSSLYHRKLILWFFVMVVVQNYFLSAPYGRNWRYLWSSQHAPQWAVAVLMVIFFVAMWAGALTVLRMCSLRHSWTMPIFAIGLGLPRWCQMLWGVSGIGLYVPWGGQVIGALLGRSLWLWLGVLDSLQGVGFGMILLQTLTRTHILGTLMGAQVIGSASTIVARLTAPDKTGPGDIFPNFAVVGVEGLRNGWFWGCLSLQIVVCLGFLVFFRKEQLFKP